MKIPYHIRYSSLCSIPFEKHNMYQNQSISWTLYFAHYKVGRGNLVLRYSPFPTFPAEYKSPPLHKSEEMKIYI